MQKKITELSVFFPTYNEEGNITVVVEAAREVLLKLVPKWEIIIVNDGSSDNTKKVAEALTKTDKRIRVVNHPKNRGYGGALVTGFKSSRYDWIVFTDSDGQFDFAETAGMIDKTDDAELVLGYRLKRADSFKRKALTYGWNILAKVLLGLQARDYSCGFKLIKKEVFEAVQPLVMGEKVTQIEFLVKAGKKGFRFAEVGVHHYPRTSGKQTGANLVVFAKSVLDLFKLWWLLR